jgi:TRAP-type C4-dicarboxylate transport system substrate-binding protein
MTLKITLTTATLALGLGFGAAAQAETVLTVSSWVPQTHFIYTDILVPYANSIATATEGRVTLNIMPAPLGSPPQHFELARTGVADITWGNFTYEPERFTAVWFAEFPFVGTDAEASSVALWRTFESHLADNAAFDGVQMLGVGLFGGGQIHHGEKPVITPEDMANQKVRIGGPIQARIMEALGAVPVAAPATKAYELLEGGVIDASLHSVESVMNFRLEDALTQHTIVPNGLYDSSFFIVMNEAKWQSLEEADRTAIAAISGEALSRLWGQQFNAQHEKAMALFAGGGHSFNEPSAELMAAITAVSDAMTAEWIEAARATGVADPAAMRADYLAAYAELSAQ